MPRDSAYRREDFPLPSHRYRVGMSVYYDTYNFPWYRHARIAQLLDDFHYLLRVHCTTDTFIVLHENFLWRDDDACINGWVHRNHYIPPIMNQSQKIQKKRRKNTRRQSSKKRKRKN